MVQVNGAAALPRWKRTTRVRGYKFFRPIWIALACSGPPDEEPGWPLKMLAGKLVKHELVALMSWEEHTLPVLPASREKMRQV